MVQRSALASVMMLLASATLFPAHNSAFTQTQTRTPPAPQTLRPADWGAPAIDVSHDGRTWTIAGHKQRVTLNESDLSTTIEASGTSWKMVPSGAHDLLVKVKGEDAWLRLADAGSIKIVPYHTGFSTGVKMTLSDFKAS